MDRLGDRAGGRAVSKRRRNIAVTDGQQAKIHFKITTPKWSGELERWRASLGGGSVDVTECRPAKFLPMFEANLHQNVSKITSLLVNMN